MQWHYLYLLSCNDPDNIMKKLSMCLLFSFILLSVSTSVHAEVFHLQFHDEIFGGHQMVDLKSALSEQYQVDANQLSIVKIDVIVKSWFGGGQLWLGSRYSQSDRRFVNGQASNFNNPADWTFNQVTFPVSGTNSDLQLNLNGQLRLREVSVSVKTPTDSGNVINDDQAENGILIPLYHLELSGLSNLDIKQLLLNDTRLNPDKYYLNAVMVAIKARHDGAQAWLENGNRVSTVELLSGAGQGFNSHDPASYDHRTIRAAKYENESSPWLLNFSGDVMLNEIVVILSQR